MGETLWLEKVGGKAYGRGQKSLWGEQRPPSTPSVWHIAEQHYGIRSLVFRSNLSNNIKSHFIISNDGNDDNNNNDNYKLWTLIGYLL